MSTILRLCVVYCTALSIQRHLMAGSALLAALSIPLGFNALDGD